MNKYVLGTRTQSAKMFPCIQRMTSTGSNPLPLRGTWILSFGLDLCIANLKVPTKTVPVALNGGARPRNAITPPPK